MAFVGAPSAIDGQNLGRIMDITGAADVTLHNLTLQNANSTLASNNSQNGGAIEANGASLSLFNVTFLNNNALSGGAIYKLGGDLEIRHATLTDGTAAAGDAIYVLGTEDRDFCNSGAVESELIFRDSVETSDFEIL